MVADLIQDVLRTLNILYVFGALKAVKLQQEGHWFCHRIALPRFHRRNLSLVHSLVDMATEASIAEELLKRPLYGPYFF